MRAAQAYPSALLLLALTLPLGVRAETSSGPPTSQPALPHRPQRAEGEGRLHVLYTTDLQGRFAWPGCDGRRQGYADIAHLITAVRHKRREIAAAGDPEPLVLAGGDLIRPDVLGNHLFSEGRAWARRTVDLLERVQFDAVSVGRYDFGARPSSLRRYLSLMTEAYIPLLASNVSCKEAEDFRCHYLGRDKRPYVVLERGDLRIGVLAVVREDLPQLIQPGHRGSIEVGQPLKLTRELIARLRQIERADLVVLLANVNLEGNTPMPVLELSRQLEQEAPVLVVADTMHDRRSNDFIDRIHPHGGPLIVGTDRFGQHLGHAVIRYRKEGSRVVIKKVKSELVPVTRYLPDHKAIPIVRDLLAELCRSLNKPLGQAYFAAPFQQDDFVAYLLEIMRLHTGAELAVLNDSAIADAPFPLEGRMTEEKLLRALRSESRLGTVRLSGKRVVELLAKYAKEPAALHVRGLTQKDGSWLVNSRPLVEGQHYRVALTSFIAGGGDALLTLGSERFADSGFTLARVATDFFSEQIRRFDDDTIIEVKEDFPDPWDKWLLAGGANLGLSFNTLAVDNGADGNRYSLPPLKRDNLTSFGFSGAIDLAASTRNHTLEGDLSLQYGKTWTQQAGSDSSTPNETLDRIKGTLLYHLALIKNLRGPGMWYIPEPYTEVTLITEFTPSGSYTEPATEQTTSYRYLDLGGTLGLGLQVFPMLFVKTGFSVRSEVLTPGPGGEVRPGLFFGYTLRRWNIVAAPTHPLHLESRLDLYIDDIGGAMRKELNLESKLNFALLPPLHVTAAHRLYVFDNRELSASMANDITLGINILWDYRHQTY